MFKIVMNVRMNWCQNKQVSVTNWVTIMIFILILCGILDVIMPLFTLWPLTFPYTNMSQRLLILVALIIYSTLQNTSGPGIFKNIFLIKPGQLSQIMKKWSDPCKNYATLSRSSTIFNIPSCLSLFEMRGAF